MSRSTVTSAASAAARLAGSRSSILPVLAASPVTPVPPLDRTNRRVQFGDHAQPLNHLGDRRYPRHRRQRHVRRTNPNPLRPPTTSTT